MPKDTDPAADTGLPKKPPAPEHPDSFLLGLIADMRLSRAECYLSWAQHDKATCCETNGQSPDVPLEEALKRYRTSFEYAADLKPKTPRAAREMLRKWSAPRHPDAELSRLEKEFGEQSAKIQSLLAEPDHSEDAMDDHIEALRVIAEKIEGHPATTLDGLRAKARALIARRQAQSTLSTARMPHDSEIATSLVRDLLTMKGDQE